MITRVDGIISNVYHKTNSKGNIVWIVDMSEYPLCQGRGQTKEEALRDAINRKNRFIAHSEWFR